MGNVAALSNNFSPKRSSPRPLLVVHSGNSIRGLLAFARIVSSVCAPSSGKPYVAGVSPRDRSSFRRLTAWNPTTGVRSTALADFRRVEIAAEPVPVRLPGVFDMSEIDATSGVGATGNMKIGSNLDFESVNTLAEEKCDRQTGTQPRAPRPRMSSSKQ